jgi:hypothetical protein
MKNDSAPGALQMFGWAMLSGILMIVGSLVQNLADPGPALRVILALLPVAPLVLMARAIMLAIAGMDELQRRIHLEAMTAAFVAAVFVAVIVGQLQHARLGFPELNWAFFYPVVLVLWTIAYIAVSRRYS